MNLKYPHRPKTAVFRMLSLFAGLALTLACLPNAHAQVLWTSAPASLNVFEGLETAPGTISLAADPKGVNGTVYKYSTFDDPSFGKERAESRGTKGFRPALGGTYFIGWREMWNPMPTNGAWVAFWQMHGYGPTGQGAPLVLRAINGDGNLYMQNNVNGTNVNFWKTKLVLNKWNTYVVHVHLATNNTGWVELWYNGVPQVFINGKTRFNCPTVDAKPGSFVLFKWGVYRSGSVNGKGPASTYMSGAKIGNTYADVNPN
ncbi:MAG TPA: heparin lyase I family protein [Terriglobales bacterium]|nr:heparin lyase I family protein [Terriglobales bacterium]